MRTIRWAVGIGLLVSLLQPSTVAATPAQDEPAPLIPTLPLPPVPEEVKPALAGAAPIGSRACAVGGYALLLLAAQNTLVPGLPVEAGILVLPALGPVFIVCGSLPPAVQHSSCAGDGEVAAVGEEALAPPFDLVGGIVDTVAAAETLAPAGILGKEASRLLSSLLTCNVVAAPVEPAPLPAAPGTGPVPTAAGGANGPPAELPNSTSPLPARTVVPPSTATVEPVTLRSDVGSGDLVSRFLNLDGPLRAAITGGLMMVALLAWRSSRFNSHLVSGAQGK